MSQNYHIPYLVDAIRDQMFESKFSGNFNNVPKKCK